jgi:hypothetical protein
MLNSTKLLLLISTFSINLAFAQSDSAYKKKNPIACSVTVDYGRVITNNPVFPPITNNSYSIELNFNKQTTGTQAWQTLQSYPRLGAELIYTSIGNHNIFGNAFGALPTLQYTFTRKHRFRWYYELGTGLAYITKPYNLVTNPENNVTGSYIDEVVVLRVGYEFALWHKSLLSPSITFIHYSNGSARDPNLGLNIYNIGLTYRFRGNEKTPLYPTRKQFRRDSLAHVSRGIHLQALTGVGFEGWTTPGGPEYHVYLFNFSFVKYINHKNKISIGIDQSYNVGGMDYIKLEEITGFGTPQYASSGTAIFAGYEWLYGHIGLAVHLGPYLKKPFLATSEIFENMGIQYYIRNPITHPCGNIFIGAHVQTYFGQAMYDDVFIGVSF